MNGIEIPDDPIILDMLPDFVESWRRDIEIKLRPLVEKQNEEELYRFGHTLRGSGRQFGLTNMSEMGIELQDLARSGSWSDFPSLHTRLRDELIRIQNYLVENGICLADRFITLPSNI